MVRHKVTNTNSSTV